MGGRRESTSEEFESEQKQEEVMQAFPSLTRTKGLTCITVGIRVGALLLFALAIAQSVNAADFTVPAGNVAALIAAINTANGNGVADTIHLAAGSTYTLTAVNSDTNGPNGLPDITSNEKEELR